MGENRARRCYSPETSSERDLLIGFDWELARNDEGHTRRSVTLSDGTEENPRRLAAIHGGGSFGLTRS